MATYLLPNLNTKQEIDNIIRHTEELVLVLRFGRDDDSVCLQLDNVVGINVTYFRDVKLATVKSFQISTIFFMSILLFKKLQMSGWVRWFEAHIGYNGATVELVRHKSLHISLIRNSHWS